VLHFVPGLPMTPAHFAYAGMAGMVGGTTGAAGVPSKRSSLVHAVRKIAPISMRVAFVTADRRLDFTSNPALSLPVRLRSNRHSTIGLVAEGSLPRRGKTIGQATEIVAIVQVF